MKKILCFIVAIMLFFSFALIGCGTKTATSSETQKPEATKTPDVTKEAEATKAPEATTAVVEYKESPYFAGKGLPPVRDRLPNEPKIANEMPEDQLNYEIGTYGGTLRVVTSYPWDSVVNFGCIEPLINTPGILGKEITGNVLKGYEVTADQKEYTFHMREGLKWSDGTPVTAKDVQFAIDDVLFNKELTPSFPDWMCSGGVVTGTPAKFTMVDDFTFKFAFDKPYGGFAINMAIRNWRGYTDLLKPSAYLMKYHKKYADPAALEAEIKAAKFKPGEWGNLFNFKNVSDWDFSYAKSIGFPSLRPWLHTKMTETISEFERNPYYFKVDTAGNQLPYIDKITSTYVQALEVINVKILAGEVDYVSGEYTSISKMPLYKENEVKGGYKTHILDLTSSGVDIELNLTYKNDNWRKVVQDERFRKALNLGINRKENLDTVYYGYAEPTNILDATYDVAAANKLLDEMGMTKGTDGFRVGPDGKKFTIPIELFIASPEFIPVTELFVEQWKALGLDVTMKTIDYTLWAVRRDANELQATVGGPETALWYAGNWAQELWGPLWNNYFTTSGKQGEKPPADVQKLYDLITKIPTDKPEDAMAAVDAVKAELKAHNWYFIHLSSVKVPIIANAKIGNVPDKGFYMASTSSIEQMFFKK